MTTFVGDVSFGTFHYLISAINIIDKIVLCLCI